MKKTINLILLILFIICSFSIILAQKNKKADYKKSYGNTTVDSINYSIDTSKISIDSLKNHLKLISSDEKKEFRKAKLLIEAQYKGDSVVLRWAVDTPGGWVTANRAGYMLSRIDLSNSKKELLTRQPMFPWSIENGKKCRLLMTDMPQLPRNAYMAA
jgi:hypothetical protein